MNRISTVAAFGVSLAASLGLIWTAGAQEPGAAKGKDKGNAPRNAGTESGFAAFQTQCMGCHGNPDLAGRAPDPNTIRQMSPERIYEALTTGVMRGQGANLSDEQKKMIALFMSGRPLGSESQGDAKNMPNHCTANAQLSDPSASAAWNGWGVDATNGRFQSAKNAGLSAAQVPKLKLKWAFGFPTGLSAYGQPSVVSGRVFVGTDIGYVYSLDAKTGCVYWSFKTKGSVRNAIVVGPVQGRGNTKYAAYFGDAHSNVYAVDAHTGEQLWEHHSDDHFGARITGAPALYNGRLFVPVSNSEEFTGGNSDYQCCTSRGSVLALNSSTGERIWKTYVIPEEPKPRGKNSKGTQLWAPAGGSVWNTPTIDAKRNAIYFGTGDAETEPAHPNTDAIMALDMDSCKMLWVYQAEEGDAFMGGCGPAGVKNENCPSKQGPDLDFGNPPILRTLGGGKQVLVAAAKDGRIIGLDPDNKGKVLWTTHIADNSKGLNGVVWGGAADDRAAYYGVSRGGIAAVQLSTGEKLWFNALGTTLDQRISHAAATTAIPGVAFVGGTDGILHAVSTKDGKELWQYNTARDYDTVNMVTAHGGAMNAPGVTVAGGMLFAGSGYGVVGGVPGNVLLAFGL